jgi:hypothetical protein
MWRLSRGASAISYTQRVCADRSPIASARVTVTRTSEKDVGHRQVYAAIDEQPPATLMFGESAAWEVTPGAHRLKANNTLQWKKLDFTAEPGEHVEFVVINKAGGFTLGFLSLLGVAPLYLTIERRHAPK